MSDPLDLRAIEKRADGVNGVGVQASLGDLRARSYDYARARDDGTVIAAIEWAAKRARRFAQRGKPVRGLKRKSLADLARGES